MDLYGARARAAVRTPRGVEATADCSWLGREAVDNDADTVLNDVLTVRPAFF